MDIISVGPSLTSGNSAQDSVTGSAIACLKHETIGRAGRHLRLQPRQPRGAETVARLLDTVTRLMASNPSLDRLTMELVAGEAGVSAQAAYRYFAHVDDLVRAAICRMQAAWHQRLLDFLTRLPAGSPEALAPALVDFVADGLTDEFAASPRLRQHLLETYHDLDYAAASAIARDYARSRHGTAAPGITADALSAGLVALWAVVKSLQLRDPGALAQPATRRMLVAIVCAAASAG